MQDKARPPVTVSTILGNAVVVTLNFHKEPCTVMCKLQGVAVEAIVPEMDILERVVTTLGHDVSIVLVANQQSGPYPYVLTEISESDPIRQ